MATLRLVMLKFFRRKKGDGSPPKDPDNNQTPEETVADVPASPSEAEVPLEAPPTESTVETVNKESSSVDMTDDVENSNDTVDESKEPAPENQGRSWFSRLKNSLSRTRANLTEGLANLF